MKRPNLRIARQVCRPVRAPASTAGRVSETSLEVVGLWVPHNAAVYQAVKKADDYLAYQPRIAGEI